VCLRIQLSRCLWFTSGQVDALQPESQRGRPLMHEHVLSYCERAPYVQALSSDREHAQSHRCTSCRDIVASVMAESVG
jgi:hypothetical protein